MIIFKQLEGTVFFTIATFSPGPKISSESHCGP
ncbi:hypothetical protein LEMLEM_LOCUS18941 [Lemmus lemmus]